MAARLSAPIQQRQLTQSPAAPPSGSVLLYFKSDGKLYKKDAAGIETEIAGGTTAAEAMGVPVSPTPPADSEDGDLWYDSDEEEIFAPILLLEAGAPVPAGTAPYTLIFEKV